MKNNKTRIKQNNDFLYQSHQQDLMSHYIEGYKHNPETKEEIEAARQAVSTILSEIPW